MMTDSEKRAVVMALFDGKAVEYYDDTWHDSDFVGTDGIQSVMYWMNHGRDYRVKAEADERRDGEG